MTFQEGDVFERGNTRIYITGRPYYLHLWRVRIVRRWPWSKFWPEQDPFHDKFLSDSDLAKRVRRFRKINE